MYALIDIATNSLLAFVSSTDGYDLSGITVVPVPNTSVRGWAWNGSALVERDLTASEQTVIALESDPRWLAMKVASPAEIDAYLDSNVTDLASARRMFKILIMVIQMLARTR